MCFGLHSPIRVAALTLVFQISYMATLLSAEYGVSVSLHPILKGGFECANTKPFKIPLFMTNSPHCDSVMAIGATNSFSETSRIVVSRLPKCDSVIFDSTKSLKWITSLKIFGK